MLLTLAPPVQNDVKPLHEYAAFKSHPTRYSPPESPRHLPSLLNGLDDNKTMSHPHRGLPPPMGLTLPPPAERPGSSAPHLGHLPAPPSQWAGADESMRQWLQAKVEEDRRRQEEERTKQENLKLDQRKIEQNMLNESFRNGVPAPMIPLIFAGIGGGNLPSHTMEWAQQYLATLSIQNQQQAQQLQTQQQQLQQFQHGATPEIHRDRVIPPNPYGPQQTIQSQVSQPVPQPVQSRNPLPGPPSSSSSNLSRLNTVDLAPQSANQSRQPLQPAPSVHSEQSSEPSLFFHHWTPPSNQQPPTPSGKSTQGSPFSQHNPSHLRSDYQSTPKKRKTAGGAVASGPTSQPRDPSPQTSSRRSSHERDMSPPSHPKGQSRRHSRQQSNGSSMDIESRPIARPSSRQQRVEEQHDSRRSGPGDERYYNSVR